jgi:ribosomal-protein-alanine N-acetyltransferase
MHETDLDTVVRLEAETFPQPWSEALFRDELAGDNRIYLVAEDDEAVVVGYGGLMLVGDDAHILTLAVIPAMRRRRLGARLLVGLVDAARAAGARHLTLEVRRSNVGAQRLFEVFGFSAVGVRKHYYRDEDAIVMWAVDIDGSDYAARLEAVRGSLP